jgi:paraquat-inducible protein B
METSQPPSPKISRAPRVPLIWFVPLVAAVIAGWMIVRQLRDHGPEISIEFKDGSGIEAGKTRLDHKGVSVGVVTAVDLKNDLSGVIVRLRLERSAAQLARGGAHFWVEPPEIGFSGVTGLDTLVSGVHLNVRPGDGAWTTRFRGLDKPPAPENALEGRAFLLSSDHLGTLLPRAPVLYRGVKVGEVETSRLADDATGIVVRLRVQTPYVDLVRTNTVFWDAGGVPLRFSLFGGAVVGTRSIGTFVTGAIAFATPTEAGAVAAEGAQFKLNSEADKDWLKWSPKIAIKPREQSLEDRSDAEKNAPALLGR